MLIRSRAAIVLTLSTRAIALQKRDVLTTLADDWCGSWRFGSNIAGNMLRLIDLDGGWLYGNNASNNYMIEISMEEPVDLHNLTQYELSLVDPEIPILKGQAFWSDQLNQTLYAFGGDGSGNDGSTTADGTFIYQVDSEEWSLQKNNRPRRLVNGANANAPAVEAGFWVGGLNNTNPDPQVLQTYQPADRGMLKFNTTTQISTYHKVPFAPIQGGGLVYLPYGEQGILVHMGGEQPPTASGYLLTKTVTPVSWNTVWVYDIATDVWFEQPTSGEPLSARSQFCTVAAYDDATKTHQLFVVGGVKLDTEQVLTDVSYLSIPSFKWYTARALNQQRMSHNCEVFGSQIFIIGGRYVNDDNCYAYDAPVFKYDMVEQVDSWYFDPLATTYSAPDAVFADVRNSSLFPETWADPALASIFGAPPSYPSDTPTPTPTSTPPNEPESDSKGLSTGALVGVIIGALLVAAIVIALAIFLFLRRRRSKQAAGSSTAGSARNSNYVYAGEQKTATSTVYSSPRTVSSYPWTYQAVQQQDQTTSSGRSDMPALAQAHLSNGSSVHGPVLIIPQELEGHQPVVELGTDEPWHPRKAPSVDVQNNHK